MKPHHTHQPHHTSHKRKEGLAAGSLVFAGEGQPETTKIRTHLYSEESYQMVDGFVLPAENQRCWIQISGLSSIMSIVEVAKAFSLSNLSLEDVFSTDQRIKLDSYEQYLAVTLRILATATTKDQQLSLFLGNNWVLSITEYASDVFLPAIRQLEDSQAKLQGGASSILFHTLVDRVVDQYLVRADELENETDELEQLVITAPNDTDAPAIHRQKAKILTLRRMTSPLKDILATLIRVEHPFLDKNTKILLTDIQDHALWLAEECEMLRETVSSIMEVYLSSLDTKMNSIMKVLTIISTIFIPLTFLTGLYGMNFSYIPLANYRWGFYGMLVCCMLVVFGMAYYFWRKQWW
ncbi:magnesium/cobalt transporter CorA [Sphaerochaeta halotolerans]|uniref:magnesium/cobalt transporter CorA n=1 Tax=Sphaerochaeta halotolerans TaxID=2293840 RepID=UPI00136D4858|nr:magnesium/cobalt transporter CorA [Sphaerochaeta halotolerans]MXI86907.1 magnesium/cobalt transporter CorA [Sphaerochaeta halotolerans]